MFRQSQVGLAALMALVTTPLLFSAGHAAVVTVNFSGTVLQATTPLNPSQFGTTLMGSFSYDNAETATYQGLNYYGGTTVIYGLSGFALNYSGGYSFPALSDSTLELETSTIAQTISSWFVNVIPRTGQAAQASFSFEGPAGYVTSTSLAVALPFVSGGQSHPLSLGFFDSNLRGAGVVVGRITSINYEPTQPAASDPTLTPEPASFVLLGVGLAGIAAVRQRRVR